MLRTKIWTWITMTRKARRKMRQKQEGVSGCLGVSHALAIKPSITPTTVERVVNDWAFGGSMDKEIGGMI
jgi:hypothetical protein